MPTMPIIKNVDHLGPDDAALWIKDRVDYEGRVAVEWRGQQIQFDSLDTRNEIAATLKLYEFNAKMGT